MKVTDEMVRVGADVWMVCGDTAWEGVRAILEAVFALIEKDKEVSIEELEYKIMALESELVTIVDQIFSAISLDKLKEVTRKNFPEEWCEFQFCSPSEYSTHSTGDGDTFPHKTAEVGAKLNLNIEEFAYRVNKNLDILSPSQIFAIINGYFEYLEKRK